MDTNHGDTYGPRGISNGHLKISIISLKRKFKEIRKAKLLGWSQFVKCLTALYDIIFLHLLSMLKVLPVPLFKQKKLKYGVTNCPVQDHKRPWKTRNQS